MITIQVTEEEAAVLFKVLGRIKASTQGPRLKRKGQIVGWLQEQGATAKSDFKALAKSAKAAGFFSPTTYDGDIARSLAAYFEGGRS